MKQFEQSSSRRRSCDACWCDKLGVVASLGCAVHCAATPWIIGALGIGWLGSPAVHQWMLIACFVLAASAFIPGYCRHHRPAALLLGLVGIAILALGAFLAPGDCRWCLPMDGSGGRSAAACTENTGLAHLLTPLGGLVLVCAHFTNRRCSIHASRCRPHELPAYELSAHELSAYDLTVTGP